MGNRDIAYEVMNDRILGLLEQGVVPWRKAWSAVGGTEGLPRNIEGRRYSGVNVFMLTARMLAEGWTDPRFLTFAKAKAIGAKVIEGSKSTPVVYWGFTKPKPVEQADGTVKMESHPFLQYANVFNVAQVEGGDIPALPAPVVVAEFDAVEAAEQVIENMPNRPSYDHNGGNRAYYIPARDEVHLPARAAFATAGGYYEIAFHELAHSTGHTSRLSRKGADVPAHFGSEPYAREELVAEFGAAFLMAEVGLDADESVENMAAYIAGWKQVVADDKRALVVAAGQAQKAADYILGRLPDEVYGVEEASAA